MSTDYLNDLRHDLQKEKFAAEYLLACAKECEATLREGIRDVFLALREQTTPLSSEPIGSCDSVSRPHPQSRYCGETWRPLIDQQPSSRKQ